MTLWSQFTYINFLHSFREWYLCGQSRALMKVGDQADQHGCIKDQIEQQLITGANKKGKKQQKKKGKKKHEITHIHSHSCLLIA